MKSTLDYVPIEWKKDLDKFLERELISANRNLPNRDPKLAELINRASDMDPPRFYSILRGVMSMYCDFYQVYLKPSLSSLLAKDLERLSSSDVKLLAETYSVSTSVDYSTRIMSRALKTHVTKWHILLTNKMGLELDESLKLITPPEETYMALYEIDHLRFAQALSEGNDYKARKLESLLLKKYHCEDKDVFISRWEKFKQVVQLPPDVIGRYIKKLLISPEKRIDYFYFSIERPWVRSLADTIMFDNLQEREIIGTFKGLPGFVLRKTLLRYLNESAILPNDGLIYSKPDTEIIKGLMQLSEHVHRSYKGGGKNSKEIRILKNNLPIFEEKAKIYISLIIN